MRSTAPGFTLQGFEVINTAGKASIAPWDTDTRSFPDFFDNDGNLRAYADLNKEYSGFLPANTPIQNQVAGPAAPSLFSADDKYFYERPFDAEERSYVIIKGVYQGNVNYYKIDLGKNDSNGIFQYYDLIRNYNFAINITNVSAAGYTTVAAAAEGSVYNNISFDIDLSHLLNMSNGNEIVYVEYTTKVITSPTPETFDFRYQYKTVSNGWISNANSTVIGLEPGPVIKSVSDWVLDNNWRVYTIESRPATTETKTQTFTVVKPSGLGRTITLILHSKWTYENMRAYPGDSKVWGVQADCNKIRRAQGQPFTLFFDLPADLSESVFPLDFVIESRQQIMENQPGAGMMDVQSDPSLFGGGQNRIQYHRHLTWTQYNSLNPTAYPTEGAQGGIMLKATDAQGNPIH
ncbi:MAG: hypothetical protein K2K29_05975, partial [Muribaculaceae bacterium]|nr:hypothetical protein [Muribaculaceae bacterium]